MKSHIGRLCGVGLLLFLGFAGLPTAERPLLTGHVSAAPKPAPEMERLANFYLGRWAYLQQYGKPGSNEKAAENTGIYTSELGPGGNSLINRFHSRGPVGDFEGMLVMTWDPREKSYKAFAFGNDFPGAIVETGQFVGDTLEFKSEITAGKVKLALRNSTHMDPQGKLISEEFTSADGAPETLLVRVVATRQP